MYITEDEEVPLMCRGSPALICETSSVTVVSVVMIQNHYWMMMMTNI